METFNSIAQAALIDESGDVVERYEYNAYGSAMIYNSDFSGTYAVSQYGNPYLLTGRRMDSIDNHANQLGFYRNRYLDYHTGRWLSHDPLGIMPNPTMPNRYYPIGQYRDGVNIYEYVSSNPGGITDAYGLWYGFFEPSLYKSMVRGISGDEWGYRGPLLTDLKKEIVDFLKSKVNVPLKESFRVIVGTIGPWGRVYLGLEISGMVKPCCYREGKKKGKQGWMFAGNIGASVTAMAATNVKIVPGRKRGKKFINPHTGKPIRFDVDVINNFGFKGKLKSLNNNCAVCKSELDGYVKLEAYAKAQFFKQEVNVHAPIGKCTVNHGCEWTLDQFAISYSNKSKVNIAAEAGITGEGGFEGTLIIK